MMHWSVGIMMGLMMDTEIMMSYHWVEVMMYLVMMLMLVLLDELGSLMLKVVSWRVSWGWLLSWSLALLLATGLASLLALGLCILGWLLLWLGCLLVSLGVGLSVGLCMTVSLSWLMWSSKDVWDGIWLLEIVLSIEVHAIILIRQVSVWSLTLLSWLLNHLWLWSIVELLA